MKDVYHQNGKVTNEKVSNTCSVVFDVILTYIQKHYQAKSYKNNMKSQNESREEILRLGHDQNH